MCCDSIRPILFLDDEVNFLDGTRRMLRKMCDEWDMRFFSKPEETLDILETLDEEVVVVTDWMMPQMDGLKFLKEAEKRRSERNFPKAYFIALTGRTESQDVVTALNSGFDDYIQKPVHPDELMARVHVGIRLLEGERKLRQANMRLQVLATTDPLTSLYNRRHGTQRLEEEMAQVLRGKQHISMILMDIDHFKKVNDTYGHDAGDKVLVAFSNILKSSLRKYDIPVRWGGEEFLVICPSTRSSEIVSVANRLVGMIRNMRVDLAEGLSVNVTASLGTVSTDICTSDSYEEPLAMADEMLYLAKARGRDCICYFAPDTAAMSPAANCNKDLERP